MGPRAPRQASGPRVPFQARHQVCPWPAHGLAHERRLTVINRETYAPWLRNRRRATMFARLHRGLPEDVYERIYNAVLDPS